MTRFLSILAFLCFTLADFHQSVAAKEQLTQTYEKMALIPGQTRTIHLEQASKVSVSRKGIIHLIESGGGVWTVTALKTGVALIEVYFRAGQKRTWYIQVSQPQKQKDTSSKMMTPLASMTDPANSKSSSVYLVKANVELIESANVETIGGKGASLGTVDFVKESGSITAIGKFESREAQFNRKILASPSFKVKEDVEAIVKSGGEIIHNKSDVNGAITSDWHEFGMSLSVRLSPNQANRPNADVLFILKAPGQQDSKYSMNQIQTSAVIPLKTKTLIGTVDLASSDQSFEQDRYLSYIPIIGPMFKQRSKSATNAIVQLWMEISSVK